MYLTCLLFLFFSANEQRNSIIIGFISLSLASVKLFYSQRLGESGEPDHKVLSKQTFLILIPVMLQTSVFLSAWVFLAAHLRFFIIVCVMLVMAANFAVLSGAVFRLDSTNKIIDAILDGVPADRYEKESRRVFYTAVLTSWISPLTVWSNNMTANRRRQQLQCNELSKKFLVISSITSSLSLSLIVLTSYAWTPVIFDGFSNYNGSSPAPLTYCFNVTENPNTCYDFFSCFSIDGNSSSVRLCDYGEQPEDLLRTFVLPGLLLGLIFINIPLALLMQYLGNYLILFKFSKALRMEIIHPTLIKDYFSEMMENPQPDLEQSPTLRELLTLASEDLINSQNPVTGNTCCHEAFRNGFMGMMEATRKVKKTIRNKVGARVLDYESKNWFEEFLLEIESRENETFNHQLIKTSKGARLIIREKEELRGKILWSLDLGDQLNNDAIMRALAFTDEAAKLLKISDSKSRKKIIYQVLPQLNKTAKISLRKIENDENTFPSSDPCFSCPSGISPAWNFIRNFLYYILVLPILFNYFTLHKCAEKRWKKPFWFFHFLLGANLEARNAEGLTALDVAMKQLEDISVDDLKRNASFFWYMLQLGGGQSKEVFESERIKERSIEIIDFAFEILNFCCKAKTSTMTPFLLGARSIEPEKLKNIFFYAIEKFCQKSEQESTSQKVESLKNLLSLGCKFTDKDEQDQTVFHKISDSNRFDLLEKIFGTNQTSGINQLNSEHQAPIHRAIEKSNVDYVKFLCKLGADLNIRDHNLKTPLHLAVVIGSKEICSLLLYTERVDINAQDYQMKTALLLASESEPRELVELLELHEAPKNLLDLRSFDDEQSYGLGSRSDKELSVALEFAKTGRDSLAQNTFGHMFMLHQGKLGSDNLHGEMFDVFMEPLKDIASFG